MTRDEEELIGIFKYQAEFDDRWGDLNTEELKKLGVVDITDIDKDEEIQPFSTNVSWSCTVNVTFKNKKYKVYLSGDAYADISYDRWETTSNYNIDEDSVSVSEIEL